jgi:hypothetical protein
VGPLKDHYLMYRVLCGLDHPGLNTALHAVALRKDSQSLDGPPSWGEEQRKRSAYASCLTAGLSVLVDPEYNLGQGMRIASIADGLNQELLKWNFGKRSWFQRQKLRLGPGVTHQIWWTKIVRRFFRVGQRISKKLVLRAGAPK